VTARLGRWWAAVPKNQWPDDGSFEADVAGKWDQEWGDRRQELVFIGIGIEKNRLQKALDTCLVPAERFQPEAWQGLADPFPNWGPATHEHA